MDHSKIGELIRENRVKRDLTQRQLAEKLMLSDKTVSKWERGMGCPDFNSIEPLADALGISVAEVMQAERIHNYQ